MTEAAIEVPAKFYKYRSMSSESAKWAERTILHNEIHFACATSFNDPFELKPVFSLQATPERHREHYLRLSRKFQPHLTEAEHASEADQVMAKAMTPEEIGNTTANIQGIYNETIPAKVGILCVSSKPDDILMWSHYADSHRGICLEFDGTFAFMAHAQKVKYSREREPINPYIDNQEVMMEKGLLTKSEHWTYEFEWRLCRYEDGPGVVQFRPANLTGIIIGALASNATVQTLMAWVQARTTPLNIYRASISHDKFELLIKPMDNLIT